MDHKPRTTESSIEPTTNRPYSDITPVDVVNAWVEQYLSTNSEAAK